MAGAAQTPSLTTLYSFTGSSGANPSAGVVFGANGSLFGTTPYGGTGTACQGPATTTLNGCGTVYELTPGTPWTETTLYSFQGGEDGANPVAPLTVGTSGVFYGTTVAGGTGNGTVFQIAAPKKAGEPWTETILYTFAPGNAVGTVSVSGSTVTLVSGTAFVTGTTWAGVSIDIDTVTYTIASVTSSTTLTLTAPLTKALTGVGYLVDSAPPGLWAGWPDGSGPQGGLILEGGKLYGTTFGGGNTGAGSIFQLTAPAGGTGPWTEEIIYNFQGGQDGSGPETGLTVTKGVLYGTTCCGTVGGTVFKLTPGQAGWTKAPVFSFSKYSQGYEPFGGLAINSSGVLYGTTQAGGSGNNGILFSLTAATGGKYTLNTIHPFTGGTDGGAPYGTPALGTGGVLYVTVTSGCEYGVGGVLEFTPPKTKGAGWTETVLYSFTGAGDGSQPFAGVILNNGNLYGTTEFDGASGYGTVYELVP
jgi:uncharacterized repeat protein (TIGR03803 family)